MATRYRLTRKLRPFAWSLVVVIAIAGASGCASGGRRNLPPGTPQPDRFLFDKGTEALNQKKWLVAREFFKKVTETYTQSPYRPDAKLGIGDTYLGEGSSESLVLAINEFQEFLSFYPTNRRADYAQYKLGVCHFKQMRGPQRDQSQTRDAIREFETFMTRYPTSDLMPEGRAKLREARDRLDESDFEVGFFYFRIRNYAGAVDRFTSILKRDPEFTSRDGVFFYLGESLIKMKREAEALPYYEKLVSEFDQSDHMQDARKRITELKAQLNSKLSAR
jgi:outer membrane protein assembly factor BamD